MLVGEAKLDKQDSDVSAYAAAASNLPESQNGSVHGSMHGSVAGGTLFGRASINEDTSTAPAAKGSMGGSTSVRRKNWSKLNTAVLATRSLVRRGATHRRPVSLL
jgi:hypothetical protein